MLDNSYGLQLWKVMVGRMSPTNHPDTVGQSCKGEDGTTLLVGSRPSGVDHVLSSGGERRPLYSTLAILESTPYRPGKGRQVLPGNQVKSGGNVDITKLPSIVYLNKSRPWQAAVFPDLWYQGKWPKSSMIVEFWILTKVSPLINCQSVINIKV